MPETTTLAPGIEQILGRVGDTVSSTANQTAEDVVQAGAERARLGLTKHTELTDQVEGSLRGLTSPDPGGQSGEPREAGNNKTELDYGDVLNLDPIALEHVLMASEKLHAQTSDQAGRLSPGLIPGPGPRMGTAVELANAAVPVALRSQLDQWQRMCADISSFKDANTAADSVAARCLAPTGGGELP